MSSSEPETMAAALAAYMSKDETYTTQKSVNMTSILASNPNNANIIQASSIGRLALSKNACRFELPMDMKCLERMTPPEYLAKYCRVIDRRRNLYRRVFDKYKLKSDKDDYVDMKLLEDCLMDVHMKSISKAQINQIINLACLNQMPAPIQINFQLFCGISALSERALYDQFVTEDTQDLQEYQKDKIECADFGSLNSKLEGVRISENMLTLLRTL